MPSRPANPKDQGLPPAKPSVRAKPARPGGLNAPFNTTSFNEAPPPFVKDGFQTYVPTQPRTGREPTTETVSPVRPPEPPAPPPNFGREPAVRVEGDSQPGTLIGVEAKTGVGTPSGAGPSTLRNSN